MQHTRHESQIDVYSVFALQGGSSINASLGCRDLSMIIIDIFFLVCFPIRCVSQVRMSA